MSETNSPDRNLEAKLAVAYEVIEKRLEAIWDAIDAIDTKTNIILGFASVVLIVLGGFFSLDPSTWRTPSLALFFLALLSYIILVILSILSYRIRDWSYNPEPTTLLKHCNDKGHSLDDIMKWVASECESAVCNNLVKLQNKSRLTNCVLYLFAAQTVLLASGLAYTLLAG